MKKPCPEQAEPQVVRRVARELHEGRRQRSGRSAQDDESFTKLRQAQTETG